MQTRAVPCTTRLRIQFRKFSRLLFGGEAAAEARSLRNVDAREARVRKNNICRSRPLHDRRHLPQATKVAHQTNRLPSVSNRRSEKGYTLA